MNKILKRILIVGGVVVGVVIVAATGGVSYILLSYNRIGDQTLNIDNKATNAKVKTGVSYKALSYNIGFSAYSQDYTFFLDTGYDADGNPTVGYYSKARSKEAVEFNIGGAIKTAKEENPDFVLFQDWSSDVCSSDLLSKFKVVSAERKQYTVSDSFSKYFDLDRCYSVQRFDVENGKSLYVVNSHMSAYDEGGTIRAKQIEELNSFLLERKQNDDYVIVGGDWNHDLLTGNPAYSYDEENVPFGKEYPGANYKKPDWVATLFNEDGSSPFADGYEIVASDDNPTCRNNDIEWDPAKTFVCCVDGFIVSDNIEVTDHYNIQTKQGDKGLDGFAYSDHEPTALEFRLK